MKNKALIAFEFIAAILIVLVILLVTVWMVWPQLLIFAYELVSVAFAIGGRAFVWVTNNPVTTVLYIGGVCAGYFILYKTVTSIGELFHIMRTGETLAPRGESGWMNDSSNDYVMSHKRSRY